MSSNKIDPATATDKPCPSFISGSHLGFAQVFIRPTPPINRGTSDGRKSNKRRKKVTNKANRSQNFFGDESDSGEGLWEYVKSLSPETIAQLSKPQSPEVFQLMERNIIGLLGNLPADNFTVSISTNREHLGRLLASAMMSGYFLRNAEQRMSIEKSFQDVKNNSLTDSE